MQEAVLRFDNPIEIHSPKRTQGIWRLSQKNTEKVRIHDVFTDGRHKGFYKSQGLTGQNTVTHCDVLDPSPGCVVMANFDFIPQAYTTLNRTVKPGVYIQAHAAFVFTGKKTFRKSWQALEIPHDIRVCHDYGTICGLEIAIMASLGKKLVGVKSSGDGHELLTFGHVLDYCAGKRTLADILALVEMEERLRSQNERQMTYKELLALARSFKGAVRSKTAAKIENSS